MLMQRAAQAIAILLFVCVAVFLNAWALGYVPTYAEYCHKSEHIGYEECATYHITLVALWHLGKFLDAIAPALTALATALIGWFTATIWVANKEQIRHNRQTERAYLWPGFAPHLAERLEGRGVRWHISILNTGHTAGTLTEIYHALVSEDDYRTGQFHYMPVIERGEVIPPSRPGEEMGSGVGVAVPTGTAISCGYIVYTDVYRDRHEQAWKHRLHAAGASEPLPRCYSDPPDKDH
jgi:hypothetical protein